MTTLTYEQCVALLANIAAHHRQIKYFGHGELWEINGTPKRLPTYPVLWAVPTSTTINENTVNHGFRLLVFDLVETGEGNEHHVLSDCQQILIDIIKVLRYSEQHFELVGDPVMEPFTERFADQVTGWSAAIEIEVSLMNTDCDVPIDEFITPAVVQGGIVLPSQGLSGYSGYSGTSGVSGFSGTNGLSGFSGTSGASGFSGESVSGHSGVSGFSGTSVTGASGLSGVSGFSGASITGSSGTSGFSGYSGYKGDIGNTGPAPSGTGLVSVTGGVLDTPSTLSARVTAEALNIRTQLGIRWAYKAADQTNTVYNPSSENDNDLFASLQANAVYRIRIVLRTGCNGTGGIRIGCTFPVGSTSTVFINGMTTGATVQSASSGTPTSGTFIGTAFNTVNASFGFVELDYVIATAGTAGNFNLIFAGQTSPQVSTIYAGSNLSIQRIDA